MAPAAVEEVLAAVGAIALVAAGYSNLEYDLDSGGRGERCAGGSGRGRLRTRSLKLRALPEGTR